MRILRELVFSLALLAAIWTAWLVIVGGVDTSFFGLRITSNEPLRPFLVATLAFALYVRLSDGFDRLWARLRVAGAGIDDRLIAFVLAAVVTGVGLVYATTVGGGPDPYGYVSQADLWLSRQLRVEQPWMAELPWPNARWTAAPLGYRPVEADGQWAIVPTYSAGLPLLMAGAKALFGHRAMFWIVPITGGLLVLATFGVGRRLGSSRVGLVAAWFVATSPIVLFMVMPPMTDVPVAAAWAASFYFLLGTTRRSIVASGLLAALAILIRPNLVILAPAMALRYLTQSSEGTEVGVPRQAERRSLTAFVLFIFCVLPGVIAVAAINNSLYGSPLTSGYGGLGDAFGVANILPNLRKYTLWFAETHTWIAIAGVIAVFVPLRRLWWYVENRRVVFVIAAVVACVSVQYLLYLSFDTWWFLRFFLPALPFVFIGLASVLMFLTRQPRAIVALTGAWLIVALGLYNVRTASKLAAFDGWIGERTYVDVAHVVRDATDEKTVVFTLIHSGSLRYYGGRMTLRFDSMARDWLDRSVAWLEARGIRAYALLSEWEVPQFKAQFAGERAADRLDDLAVVLYKGGNTMALYDLTAPPATSKPRVVFPRDPTTLRAVPPASPPTLVLKSH